MSQGQVQRRLAAIVAADVVGYSRLMERDEAGTLAALMTARRELIDPVIANHRGQIIKTTGDGLLIEFPSVTDAVVAAVRIQRGLAQASLGRPDDQKMIYRIGINIGDVIIADGDIYGDGVNIAVRLEGLCRPGGVMVSRGAFEQMRDTPFPGFADRGQAQVKNIDRPVAVLELSPDAIAGLPDQAMSVVLPMIASANVGSGQELGRPAWKSLFLGGLAALMTLTVLAAALTWRTLFAPPEQPKDLRSVLGELMPTTSRDEIDRIAKLFGAASPHRSFALELLSGRHRWTASWPTQDTAEEKALEECQLSFGKPCVIVASDDAIVPPDASGKRPERDAPLLHYAGPFRLDRIPIARTAALQRADVTSYGAAKDSKAIAIHPKGDLTIVTGAESQTAAEEQALKTCNQDSTAQDKFGHCYLYASGDQVVLPLRKIKPMSQ